MFSDNFKEKWNSYFGSVRFFKNLILLVVIILIIIPTVAAFNVNHELKEIKEEFSITETDKGFISKFEIGKNGFKYHKPEYAKLYPDFYAPAKSDEEYKESSKAVYLTFDDGPSYNTDQILDELKKYDAHATFFVIGRTSDEDKERMKRIVDSGSTIGMHSYSHDYEKIYSSVEEYLDDMYKLFCLIKDTTGETPTVFRMPGGSINAYNSGIYMEILSEMIRRGFVPFDWNISSEDATVGSLDKQSIVYNVTSAVTDKDMKRRVVLMHDAAGKDTTAEAIGPILHSLVTKEYKLEGLKPETIPLVYSYATVK